MSLYKALGSDFLSLNILNIFTHHYLVTWSFAEEKFGNNLILFLLLVTWSFCLNIQRTFFLFISNLVILLEYAMMLDPHDWYPEYLHTIWICRFESFISRKLFELQFLVSSVPLFGFLLSNLFHMYLGFFISCLLFSASFPSFLLSFLPAFFSFFIGVDSCVLNYYCDIFL